jgi:pilus assembly protein CpaF
MDRATQQKAIDTLKNALKPIAAFFDDPEVQEIMINGPSDVWVERRGELFRTEVAMSETSIQSAIFVLARLDNKEARAGRKDGIIDARFEGMRIAAVMAPTAVKSHAICIRKHLPRHLCLDDYVRQGGLPAEQGAFLAGMVAARRNVIVAGATSSGKTSLVNALLAKVDIRERVVTIEDTPELAVSVPNWVPLETNESEGVGTRDLVRLALRFRPDRLIVGEVRGAEAFDLMQAANTGHEGCIATLHANNALAALARLESLVLTAGINWPLEAVQSQIAQTFHYVIYMQRRGGRREVSQILRLTGYNAACRKYVVSTVFDQKETIRETCELQPAFCVA